MPQPLIIVGSSAAFGLMGGVLGVVRPASSASERIHHIVQDSVAGISVGAGMVLAPIHWLGGVGSLTTCRLTGAMTRHAEQRNNPSAEQHALIAAQTRGELLGAIAAVTVASTGYVGLLSNLGIHIANGEFGFDASQWLNNFQATLPSSDASDTFLNTDGTLSGDLGEGIVLEGMQEMSYTIIYPFWNAYHTLVGNNRNNGPENLVFNDADAFKAYVEENFESFTKFIGEMLDNNFMQSDSKSIMSSAATTGRHLLGDGINVVKRVLSSSQGKLNNIERALIHNQARIEDAKSLFPEGINFISSDTMDTSDPRTSLYLLALEEKATLSKMQSKLKQLVERSDLSDSSIEQSKQILELGMNLMQLVNNYKIQLQLSNQVINECTELFEKMSNNFGQIQRFGADTEYELKKHTVQLKINQHREAFIAKVEDSVRSLPLRFEAVFNGVEIEPMRA